MKTTLLIAMIAITTTAFAQEAPKDKSGSKQEKSILVKRAKLTEPTEIADFDAKMDQRYGTKVMAALIAADAQTPEKEAAVLADLYIAGKFKPTLTEKGKSSGHAGLPLNQLSRKKRSEVLAHIAAKPTIEAADAKMLVGVSPAECQMLKAREADILAALPSSCKAREVLKYTKFAPKNDTLLGMRTPQELLNKTYRKNLSGKEYNALRKEMLARCTGAMTRSRRAANLPNDDAAFNAAMAPILAALNAPLWQGLKEATSRLGIDITVPDCTELTAWAAKTCAAMEGRKISDVSKCDGSLMFVKGTEEYKSWSKQFE